MSKPGTGPYTCYMNNKTFIFFLSSVPASYDIYLRDVDSGAPITTPVRAQVYRAWPPFYQEDIFDSHYQLISALDPGLTLYLTPLKRAIVALVT
jgi:hypothetical protein